MIALDAEVHGVRGEGVHDVRAGCLQVGQALGDGVAAGKVGVSESLAPNFKFHRSNQRIGVILDAVVGHEHVNEAELVQLRVYARCRQLESANVR